MIRFILICGYSGIVQLNLFTFNKKSDGNAYSISTHQLIDIP